MALVGGCGELQIDHKPKMHSERAREAKNSMELQKPCMHDRGLVWSHCITSLGTCDLDRCSVHCNASSRFISSKV